LARILALSAASAVKCFGYRNKYHLNVHKSHPSSYHYTFFKLVSLAITEKEDIEKHDHKCHTKTYLITHEPQQLRLAGPVSENSDWPVYFALATILWLLVVAAYFKKLPYFSLPRLLLYLALGQVFSVYLVTMANFLWFTSYNAS